VTDIYDNGTKYFHANSKAADSQAIGQESVAIGPQSVARGDNALAAGNGAKAIGNGSLAMGFGAQATGDGAIAVGTGAQSSASQGTAIGFGAVAIQAGGVALGAGSVASTAAGIAGYVPPSATSEQAAAIRATTSTQAAVSVGDAAKGRFRQITGVAAGTADSDATNVAQLKATANTVKAGSVQYATNPDGSVNYNEITLGGGQAPGGTRIGNVAPGVLPGDAVNLQQLSQVQNQVSETAGIAYSGVAIASAMSSLPQAMTPGKSLMSLGVGSYSGYGALAFGYSYRTKDGNWVYKVNGGFSGKKTSLGVGVGYEW